MPALRRALAEQAGQIDAWDTSETDLPSFAPCPIAEDVCQHTVWLKQTQLLGDHEDMDDIVAAVSKIQRAVN